MAEEEGRLEVPDLGKSLDTRVITQTGSGHKAHREIVANGDPEDSDAIQKIGLISKAARVTLYGPDGHPVSLETVGGTHALVVHDEDIDTILVNQLAHEHTATITNPSIAISAGDTSITLASAVGFATGDRLLIEEGANDETHLPQITDLTGLVATLDGPIDVAYTTAATVALVKVNLAATAGTLSSPISYIVRPHSSVIWHLTRLNFTITHGSAGDDSKFGSIDKLTNGIVIRSRQNGVFKTLTNWKSNQSMIEDMYDVTYTDKAGPGLFGTRGRWSFKQRTQTVTRLDGALNDELEVLVQDDLDGVTDFQINMQGHVDEESE